MIKSAWEQSPDAKLWALRRYLKFGRHLMPIAAASESIRTGEVGSISGMRFIPHPKFRKPIYHFKGRSL